MDCHKTDEAIAFAHRRGARIPQLSWWRYGECVARLFGTRANVRPDLFTSEAREIVPDVVLSALTPFVALGSAAKLLAALRIAS